MDSQARWIEAALSRPIPAVRIIGSGFKRPPPRGSSDHHLFELEEDQGLFSFQRLDFDRAVEQRLVIYLYLKIPNGLPDNRGELQTI